MGRLFQQTAFYRNQPQALYWILRLCPCPSVHVIVHYIFQFLYVCCGMTLLLPQKVAQIYVRNLLHSLWSQRQLVQWHVFFAFVPLSCNPYSWCFRNPKEITSWGWWFLLVFTRILVVYPRCFASPDFFHHEANKRPTGWLWALRHLGTRLQSHGWFQSWGDQNEGCISWKCLEDLRC